MSGDYRGYIGYRTTIGGIASPTTPVAEYTSSSPASGPFSSLLRGRAPMKVRFEASASQPVSSFSWDFGDGTKGSGERPEHRYTRPGDHFAALTVTDTRGAKSVFVTDVVVDKRKPAGRPSIFLITLPTAVLLSGLLFLGYRGRFRRISRPA
jgi:PKD repeat protein